MTKVYPATFKEVGNKYLISFRDIPEAKSQASSYEEAVQMATKTLKCAYEAYRESAKPFPEPSAPSGDFEPIPLITGAPEDEG